MPATHSTTPDTGFRALLAEWIALVDCCVVGYPGSLAMFERDVAVRAQLDRALERVPAAERAAASAEVAVEDERFRALLHDSARVTGVGPWWTQRVLRKAGPEYAANVRLDCGAIVELALPALDAASTWDELPTISGRKRAPR